MGRTSVAVRCMVTVCFGMRWQSKTRVAGQLRRRRCQYRRRCRSLGCRRGAAVTSPSEWWPKSARGNVLLADMSARAAQLGNPATRQHVAVEGWRGVRAGTQNLTNRIANGTNGCFTNSHQLMLS